MPSGNPPRRSKKQGEPQTIDLEAERIEPDAAEAAVEPAPEPAVEPVQQTTASDEAESATTESPAEAASKPATSEETKRSSGNGGRGGSGAGLIAAGIVSGLVVLAGAGAAQYAGYIPNLGPETKIEIPDYSPQIATLQEKLDALTQKVNQPPAIDLSTIETRIGDIETAMTKLPVGDLADVLALKGKLAETAEKTSKLENELAAVASRLVDTEIKVNTERNDVEVARAIASSGLKAAIDRGGSFSTELQTLASITPDDPALQQLQAYAAKGVLSRSQLVQAFPDVADNLLAVLNKPDPDTSLSERLFKSAFSVIKVRPVGNVEGDSPQAIIARVGDKLDHGDLKAASEEWNALPDELKSVGANFKKELDARIAVEELAAKILTVAVSGKQG